MIIKLYFLLNAIPEGVTPTLNAFETEKSLVDKTSHLIFKPAGNKYFFS